MRTFALIAGLAISVAAAPVASQATCQKRTIGTIIGAVTGGLLGHSAAGRGDQVSRCKRGPGHTDRATGHPRARSYEAPRYAASSCRFETAPFYDASGQVVSRPTRVCGRF